MRRVGPATHRRAAFTLVELLVVIGIIALLISILLPALNTARERALRVSCASNLRQVGTQFQIYAQQYRDAVPIGYMAQRQFSYVIHWNNAGSNPPKPSQMGLLALAGLMKAPQAFYCPTEQDRQYMYDTPENQWVFDRNPPHPYLTQAGTGRHTRMGYSSRPVADWPSNTSWPTNDPRNFVPRLEPLNATPVIVGLPKMNRLKNKAILADIVVAPSWVDRRHKNGVNVLFGHGAVAYVPRKAFDKGAWKSIPPPPDDVSVSYNDIMLRFVPTSTTEPEAGLWADLDKY